MNKVSSAARLAAMGWSTSRQWTRSAPLFVGPGWQRSRQQTGESAERAPRSARRQAQRIGDEAWTQRQLRVERAPRDLRSRNDRLTHEAQSERREKHGPRPRSPRGQEAQTCPCRGGDGSQPNRKITRLRPEIMSQKPRNSAARAAATLMRRGAASSQGRSRCKSKKRQGCDA